MLGALSLAAASRMSQTPMLAVRSILLAAPSLCCSLHRTAAAPFAAVTSWKKLINSRLVFLHLLQQWMELLPPCSRAHTHTHAQTPQDTHGANVGQCSTLPTWALGMLAKVQWENWTSQEKGTAFGFPLVCWKQSQNANLALPQRLQSQGKNHVHSLLF